MTIPPLTNPLPLSPPVTFTGVPAAGTPDAGATGAATPSFGQQLSAALNGMEQLQSSAGAQVAQLVGGGGGDLHASLIAVEKSDLAFGLMLQLRNKAVAAYQDISHMNF